jgi:hypothetical protein
MKMQRVLGRNLPIAFIIVAALPLLSGCATTSGSSFRKRGIDAAGNIPLFIRGQYATLRLEFPVTDQKVDPGQFQNNEICYVKAGGFRIDCFADGSSLNYGPNDSSDLLTDHAPSTLEPADDDSGAAESMRLYALVTLIAGSIDRLPVTLADYLQNPGQHLGAAMELADQLLGDEPVHMAGYARGGNFVVTMELDDAGREKIVDALDEHSADPSQLQYVNAQSTAVSRHSRFRISKVIRQQRPISSMPRSRTLTLGVRDESHAAASIVNGPSRTSRAEVSKESRFTGGATH